MGNTILRRFGIYLKYEVFNYSICRFIIIYMDRVYKALYPFFNQNKKKVNVDSSPYENFCQA